MKTFEEMQSHEQRVVVERDEALERLNKLKVFAGLVSGIEPSKFFKALPERDQELLTEQAIVMRMYVTVLNQRIERF